MKTITHILPVTAKTSRVFNQLLEEKKRRREQYATQSKVIDNDNKQAVCA